MISGVWKAPRAKSEGQSGGGRGRAIKNDYPSLLDSNLQITGIWRIGLRADFDKEMGVSLGMGGVSVC